MRKNTCYRNWLGQEGLLFIEAFTHKEKEKCKTKKVLISLLKNRLMTCHNYITLAVQYQKLHRKSNESAQEWKGRLETKVAKCKTLNDY